MSTSLAARFWSKVKIGSPEECWEWTRARHKFGYGTFQRKRTDGRWIKDLAHRVAWELTNGPIPDGKCICHSCDNPPCCNPKHLWVGTQTENTHDSTTKGRRAQGDQHYARTHPERLSPLFGAGGRWREVYPDRVPSGDRHYARTNPEKLARGERHGCAKITEEQVREIRRLYASRVADQYELAKMFGLTQAGIWRIVNRKVWKHLL